MALDYGGCCHGVAFRLPEGNDHAQMLRLLRREASYKEDLPFFRWIDVQSGSHKFRALTFWAAPRSKGYYVDLPLEEQRRGSPEPPDISAHAPNISTTRS